jgi:DNA-binding response OmpR family regulator
VTTVASILISEAEPDVRRLLAVMVERLGHDAAVLEPDLVAPPRGDLLIVEPAAGPGLEHARLVRAFFPDAPIVCLGPLPADAGFLGRGRIHNLAKPFTLEQLGAVLDLALERTHSPV